MILFDGDVLTYKAGFAAETRYYEVGNEKFQSIKDAREHGTPVMRQDAKEERIALSYVDKIINSVRKEVKLQEYKVFLTNDDLKKNDRWKMDKTYKSNRKGGSRPVHYRAIRQHLIDVHKAEVVEGIEADDALGKHMTPAEVEPLRICVSVDKDLLMVPGLHYNLSTKVFTKASDPGYLEIYKNKAGDKRIRGVGFKWFCAQMLLGDAVDNIVGVSRIGPVRTHKILDPIECPKKMWEVIQKTYIDKGMEDKLYLNAHLLWIERAEGDTMRSIWHETKLSKGKGKKTTAAGSKKNKGTVRSTRNRR